MQRGARLISVAPTPLRWCSTRMSCLPRPRH